MQNITHLYQITADNAHINVTKEALSDGLAYNETLQFSSKWIQDASFLRLENVTLSYNINVSSVKWLSNFEVYVTGQNLFVITNYNGFDPEVSNGIDVMNYPRPKTMMMGVRVQF